MVLLRGNANRELVIVIVAIILSAGLFVSMGGASSIVVAERAKNRGMSIEIGLDGNFPPLPISPSDNSWTNMSTPTLQWRFIPEDLMDEQTGFTVQVDDDGQFMSVDRTSGDVISSAEKWTVSPSLAEGLWHWRVRVRDVYGQWSPYSTTRRFNIDTSSPETNLIIGSPNFEAGGLTYVAASTSLSLSSLDDGIGVLQTIYRTWNGTWSPWISYRNPFSLIGSEGLRFIEFHGVDKLWNIESNNNLTLYMDDTSPKSSFRITGRQYDIGEKHYIGSSAGLELDAVDEGAGVNLTQYRIDGGPWTGYTRPLTFENASGIQTIGYRSLDNVSNMEDENFLTLFVDTKPPHTVLTIGPPKYGTNPVYVKSSTMFGLTSVDDTTAVKDKWFKIDGGNWTRYSSDFTITVPGQHTLHYYATDVVGNQEFSNFLKIYVDDEPPATSMILNGAIFVQGNMTYVTSATVFSLISTDAGSGVKTVSYIIDSGVGPSYDRPFTINKPGSHTLRFHAVDRLMNQEMESVVDVHVDDEPPVTTLTISQSYQDSDPLRVDLEAEFNLTASDAGSGLATTFYRIDNGSWAQYFLPFNLSDCQQGVHVVHFYSVDNLGNDEEVMWMVVSTEQPVATGSIIGKVVSGDMSLINVTLVLNTNSTTFTDSSGLFVFLDLLPGNYTLFAFKDGYENATTVAIVEAGGKAIAFIVMAEVEPPPLPPSDPGSRPSSTPNHAIGLILIVVIVAVVLSLILLKRRKKANPEGKEWLNKLEDGLEGVVDDMEEE